MNRKILTIVAAALVVAVTMKPADAQLGKLLREGVEYLGKQAGKVAKEGTEFLWNRKGSVAVAAAATAVVLAPSDFVQAGENVATSTITTVGSNVIQPLITETAQHVAGPVAREVTKQAAANFPWTLAFCLLFLGVAGGLGYLLVLKR